MTAAAPSTVDGPANDAGKLVLRVALGVLILLHGIAKLANGIGPIAGSLARAGLPEGLAYGVYVGEVLAPVLVILGVWTRAAALVIVVNMIVAVLLVHTGQLLALTKSGGYALELQAIYLFGALALALLGAGRYRLGPAGGRWN